MGEEIRLALLALLRKLEWSRPYGEDDYGQSCPICHARKDDEHRYGCELDAAIKALAKQPT